MGSARSKGRKNQRTRKSSARPTPKAQAPQPVQRERGTWLTVALAFIALHAVLTAVLLLLIRKPGVTPVPWLWAAAIAIALAQIAAVVAMWYWKKWGLYLFVAAALAGIAVGLIVFPMSAIIVAFHGIIPAGILGMILTSQNKLRLFE